MISSAAEFVTLMAEAKKCRGGQFVTIYGEKEKSLNKGRGANAIDPNFKPLRKFHAQFHFGEDYDKKVAKIMANGDDAPQYDADKRSNITHLVPNVVMQYLSTQTICLIVMPTDWYEDSLTLNGRPLTKEEVEYMSKYLKKPSKSSLPYFTIGLKNITKMVIGKETYEVHID